MSLEIKVLCLIRSFREHRFSDHVQSLIALVPWFFALNHTNYKRWLPVYIKDMLELPKRHPEIYQAFQKGFFTGQKTSNRFSSIALDQIHEQENVKVKGLAGATPIIEKEKSLLQWMVAGPEVSRILEEFEDSFVSRCNDVYGYHHEEGLLSQLRFKQDVDKLVCFWEDIGNPFDEETSDLINVYDRTVASPEIADCLFSLEDDGKKEYAGFVKDVFVTKKRSILLMYVIYILLCFIICFLCSQIKLTDPYCTCRAGA